MTRSSSSTKIVLLALIPTVLSQGASVGSAACAYVNGFSANCAGGNSDFTLLPFTSQASCLCYYSTTWNPDNYDSAFNTCLSHIKTALPSNYFKITSFNGGPLNTTPCRAAGNVRHYSETKIDSNLVACNDIAALVVACVSNYPGFVLTAPFASRAPCLCYRNADPNSYIGPIYDSSALSCFQYYSTANPVVYSSLVQLTGGEFSPPPCQSVKALSTSRSEPKPSTSSSPSPGSSPTPVIARPTSSTSSRSTTITSTTTEDSVVADAYTSLTGSAESVLPSQISLPIPTTTLNQSPSIKTDTEPETSEATDLNLSESSTDTPFTQDSSPIRTSQTGVIVTSAPISVRTSTTSTRSTPFGGIATSISGTGSKDENRLNFIWNLLGLFIALLL